MTWKAQIPRRLLLGLLVLPDGAVADRMLDLAAGTGGETGQTVYTASFNYFLTSCTTWANARAECQTSGGDLVVIPDAAKNTEVTRFMQNTGANYGAGACNGPYPWIGANGCTGSTCNWIDGTPWSFTGPGFSVDDPFGHMYTDGRWGTWNSGGVTMGICELPNTGTCTVTSSRATYANTHFYYIQYLFDNAFDTIDSHDDYWMPENGAADVTLTFQFNPAVIIERIKLAPKSRGERPSQAFSATAFASANVAVSIGSTNDPNMAVGQFAEYQVALALSLQRMSRSCHTLVVTISSDGGYMPFNEIQVYEACAAGWSGDGCTTNIDECAATPCQNSGVCADGVNAYTCSCAAGYQGTNCATNIDECAPGPCQNSGVCTDGVNAYTCACVSNGWEGTNCASDLNECSSSPCSHGAACTESSTVGSIAPDAYSCACVDGYASGMCAYNEIVPAFQTQCQVADSNAGSTGDGNCAVDVNECASSPCQNGGVCSDTVSDWSCDCLAVSNSRTGSREGHEGETCDTPIDVCAVNEDDCDPLYATCHHLGPGLHDCTCNTGWSGDGHTCADVDECSSSPCQNSAACVQSGCADSPFPNGVQCSPAAATLDGTANAATASPIHMYACVCPAGFTNGACGYALSASLSQYNADCSVADGGNCDIDVNECASSPCLNGAVCTDSTTGPDANGVTVSPDSYRCTCPAGFANGVCDYSFISPTYDAECAVLESSGAAGGNCDLDVDECASNPCANSAVCSESTGESSVSFDAFQCTCAAGFANGMCEYNFISQYTAECTVAESTASAALNGICDIDVDECASSPCAGASNCTDSTTNDGTCSDPVQTSQASCTSISATWTPISAHAYRCTCPQGIASGVCDYNFISQYNVECTVRESDDSVAQVSGDAPTAVAEACTAVPGTTTQEAAAATSCSLVAAAGAVTDSPESCSAVTGTRLQELAAATTCTLQANACTVATGSGSCTYAAAITAAPAAAGTCTLAAGAGSCSYVAPVAATILGGNCEIDVNECESTPCANGGVCVDSNSNGGHNGADVPDHNYRCTCVPGYANGVCTYEPQLLAYGSSCFDPSETGQWPTGPWSANCDLDVDECVSSPCRHNGTCSQTVSITPQQQADLRAGLGVAPGVQLTDTQKRNGGASPPTGPNVLAGKLYVCDCSVGYGNGSATNVDDGTITDTSWLLDSTRWTVATDCEVRDYSNVRCELGQQARQPMAGVLPHRLSDRVTQDPELWTVPGNALDGTYCSDCPARYYSMDGVQCIFCGYPDIIKPTPWWCSKIVDEVGMVIQPAGPCFRNVECSRCPPGMVPNNISTECVDAMASGVVDDTVASLGTSVASVIPTGYADLDPNLVSVDILSDDAAVAAKKAELASGLAGAMGILPENIVIELSAREVADGRRRMQTAVVEMSFTLKDVSNGAMYGLTDTLGEAANPNTQALAALGVGGSSFDIDTSCPEGKVKAGADVLCHRCPASQRSGRTPEEDPNTCIDCAAGRAPTDKGDYCRCAEGFYNSTRGRITCYESGLSADVDPETQLPMVPTPVEFGGTSDDVCAPCPETESGLSCATCTDGVAKMKPGFMTTTKLAALGTALDKMDGTRSVFQCPMEVESAINDVTDSNCLGDSFYQAEDDLDGDVWWMNKTLATHNASWCAFGYAEGALCSNCDTRASDAAPYGYGRGGIDRELPCEPCGGGTRTFWLFIGAVCFGIGVALLYYAVGDGLTDDDTPPEPVTPIGIALVIGNEDYEGYYTFNGRWDAGKVYGSEIEKRTKAFAKKDGIDMTNGGGWPSVTGANKDAKAVAEQLEGFGYQVTLLQNASKEEMKEAIKKLEDDLRDASDNQSLPQKNPGLKDGEVCAFIFYCGHGMQVESENMVVPCDCPLFSDFDSHDSFEDGKDNYPKFCVKLEDLLKAKGGTKGPGIAIMDAGHKIRSGPFDEYGRDKFICPIRREVMQHPACLQDEAGKKGWRYEQSAINEYLEISAESPRTGKVLQNARSVLDAKLRQEIVDYTKQSTLHEQQPPVGNMLLVFSGQHDTFPAEPKSGDGRLYVTELLRLMNGSKPCSTLFRAVRQLVMLRSRGVQVPWEVDHLEGADGFTISGEEPDAQAVEDGKAGDEEDTLSDALEASQEFFTADEYKEMAGQYSYMARMKSLPKVGVKFLGRIMPSLRIAIGLTQVLSGMNFAFEVTFPPVFTTVIAELKISSLDFMSLVKFNCIGDWTFYHTFTSQVLMLPVFVGIMYMMWRMHNSALEGMKGLPWPPPPPPATDEPEVEDEPEQETANPAKGDGGDEEGADSSTFEGEKALSPSKKNKQAKKDGKDKPKKGKDKAKKVGDNVSDIEVPEALSGAALGPCADLAGFLPGGPGAGGPVNPKKVPEYQLRLFQKALDFTFTIVFMIYPVVSQTIFSTFLCQTLDNEEELLIADFQVECYTDDHTVLMVISTAFVILYPIGVPLVIFVSLFKNREELCKEDSPVRETFASLVEPYKLECWYWEALEMFRKITLTGLMIFWQRGSIQQLVIGIQLSAFFMAAAIKIQPFQDRFNNDFKVVTDAAVMITFNVAILMSRRVDKSLEPAWFGPEIIDGILIVVNMVIPSCVVLWHLFGPINCSPKVKETKNGGGSGGGGALSPTTGSSFESEMNNPLSDNS